MNNFRKTRSTWLVTAALLAGCQSVPPLAAPSGERTLTVRLQPTDRQVLAARRNMVSDLDHYEIELLRVVNGTPTPTGMAHTSEGLQGYTFTFEHLGPETYLVRATGYDTADNAITDVAEQTIDLTATTVELTPSVNLTLTMANAPFSGTLVLPTGADFPADVTELRVQLRDAASGNAVGAPFTYTSTQARVINHLKPNRDYDVNVTAVRADGKIAQTTARVSTKIQADVATVEDRLTPTLSFGAYFTALDTYFTNVYDIYHYGRQLTIDNAQNVWTSLQYDTPLTRLSPTGVVDTFRGNGGNICDIDVDAQGNVWTVSHHQGKVFRMAPNGDVTAYTVGGYPTELAADASGNAWVVNGTTISRLTAAGDVTAYAVDGYLTNVAVDAAGNAWVVSTGGGKVSRITPTGDITPHALDQSPRAVVVDANDNKWVGAYGKIHRFSASDVQTDYNVSGASIAAMVSDGNGGVWTANEGTTSVTHVLASGDLASFPLGVAPAALAVDGQGGVWTVNKTAKSVSHVSTTGSVDHYPLTAAPLEIAVDASGKVWIGTTHGLMRITP